MDIDLLFTPNGDTGLISNTNFIQKVAGVLFSMSTGMMTIEYVDMDYTDLNIPVDSSYYPALDRCFLIHVGAFVSGHIAQAYQVPFMIQDDPYRNQMAPAIKPPESPLMAFDHYMRRCTTGQPVNREDLSDESHMGCILGDAVPSALQFAPHLARRLGFEVAPTLAPGPNMPGLGLGSSGGGGSGRIIQQPKKDTGKKDTE